MDIEQIRQRAWFSWASIILLAASCGVLAILQYRWIGEVAEAEHGRLQADLQSRLNLLRRSFDEQTSEACSALVPSASAIERLGRDEAYLQRYRRADESKEQLVRRIALAVPQDGALTLFAPDPERVRFLPTAWPSEWTAVRERLSARLLGERLGPDQASTLIEVPRFGRDGGDASNGRRPAEQEWLLIDLDVDYTRGTLLPAMLNRYLGDSGLDYDAEVVVNGNPSQQIYRSPSDHDHRSRLTADASVALLDTGPMTFSPNNRPLYGGPAHSGPPRPGPPPPDS